MDRRNNRTYGREPIPGRRGGMPGERVLSAIILGIFLLIAAGIVGGKLSDLNKTLTDKNFSDTNSFNAPDEITAADRVYFDVNEAAAYLHMSADEVTALITSKEIDEYIRTDNGFVIAKTVLDAWFENEAYQIKIGNEGTSTDDE